MSLITTGTNHIIIHHLTGMFAKNYTTGAKVPVVSTLCSNTVFTFLQLKSKLVSFSFTTIVMITDICIVTITSEILHNFCYTQFVFPLYAYEITYTGNIKKKLFILQCQPAGNKCIKD